MTAAERNAIEEHLKNCSLCSDALLELQKTVEHIKAIEEMTPPAWIKEKIMANVRDKSQKRKGFFAKLFLPLSIKLPIQAVAMLFLIVTAFYIYRNIPSAMRPSEEPQQELATKQETRHAERGMNEIDKAHEAASPTSQVPQSPGYKALDMKPEYEKSAPAIPFGQAGTHASIRPNEHTPFAKKAAGERLAISPQPSAPAVRQEQATGAMKPEEIKPNAETQTQKASIEASAEEVSRTITVEVKDIEAASGDIEQAITKLGVSITRREPNKAERFYVVTVDAHKFLEFEHMLRLIGEIKNETVAPPSQSGRIELTIELMNKPAHP